MYLRLNKGQISIEMIIILAVLIIAAILVGVLIINSANRNIDSTGETNDQIGSVIEDYIEDVNAYETAPLVSLPGVNNVYKNTLVPLKVGF